MVRSGFGTLWYGFLTKQYKDGAYVLIVDNRDDLMRLGSLKKAQAEGYKNEVPFSAALIAKANPLLRGERYMGCTKWGVPTAEARKRGWLNPLR